MTINLAVKYHSVRCECCGHKLDLNEYLELDDYDVIEGMENEIEIYCDTCGESNIVKIN